MRNLLHYLALRRHDLRALQSRLAAFGLSSLGRIESSVPAGLDAVIAILAEHAQQLLGPVHKGRALRIMVTMPSEAARSYELVKSLVEAGMDLMRVNCAHDSTHDWEAMIVHMRRANAESGKHCKALMDLAGPKLRTGPIQPGSRVVRWRISKNVRGSAVALARIALVARHAGAEPLACDARLPVPVTLLRLARVGGAVRVKDSRKRTRRLAVVEKADHACICTCDRSGYLLSCAKLALVRGGKEIETSHVGDLPFVEEPIRLHPGDLLVVTREEATCEESQPHDSQDNFPHVSCTLPEVFSTARAGQPIFFDDGRIEGYSRSPPRSHAGRDRACGRGRG